MADQNISQVKKYHNSDVTAFDLIQQIASLGDGSYNRWLAFVLERRKLIYEAASISVRYKRRIADGRQEFYDLQERSVPYSELRPNGWLRTLDAFPHQLNPANLVDDFQASFIESVEWTENGDQISIGGKTGDSMQVMIARLAAQGDMLL